MFYIILDYSFFFLVVIFAAAVQKSLNGTVGCTQSIFSIAARITIKNKREENNSFFFPAFSTRVAVAIFFIAFASLEVPSATPPPRAL